MTLLLNRFGKKGTVVDDENAKGALRKRSIAPILQRNWAYVFLTLAGLALCISLESNRELANHLRVIPVLTVIDANGHVIKQSVVRPEVITGQEAYVQSVIHDFIVDCNTFDPKWRQHFADLCHLHASESVAKQYDAEVNPENVNNPYYQVGAEGRRWVKVTGMTPVDRHAYQVTFQSITERGGGAPKTEYFRALVRYEFTGKPLALGDRWENGLGFAATAYRKDQELSQSGQ